MYQAKRPAAPTGGVRQPELWRWELRLSSGHMLRMLAAWTGRCFACARRTRRRQCRSDPVAGGWPP